MPIPGICPMPGQFVRSYSLQSYSTGTSSGGTTITVTKPSGTVSGDILVAVMASATFGSVTWTGDSGWTEVCDQGAQPSLRVAYKVAGGAEGASYTFTASGSAVGGAHILCFRELQYDTIGASVSTLTGDGALSVTGITAAGGILIAAVGTRNGSSVTHSTPTGMTAIATTTLEGGIGGLSTFYANVSSGATGSKSSTVTNSVDESGGILIGLKPA